MLHHRWTVILAGGHGTRLQSLTRLIAGDERPKQFCRLLGGSTLLAQTRARLAPVAPIDRTSLVLLKSHEPYYRAEFVDVHPSRLFVQPTNKGTTAAIAFALLRLLHLDRQAIVGFFPTDHYYADNSRFASAIELAYTHAQDGGDRLVLIGAKPGHPEVEYGWIEPGAALGSPVQCLSRVAQFWEKPALRTAERLFQRGCLWNTFVMVGRIEAFLGVLSWTVPQVLETLSVVASAAGSDLQQGQLAELYDRLQPGDFSHQVLSAATDRLAVLRMDDAGWSDLGTPQRLFAALRRFPGVFRSEERLKAHV